MRRQISKRMQVALHKLEYWWPNNVPPRIDDVIRLFLCEILSTKKEFRPAVYCN